MIGGKGKLRAVPTLARKFLLAKSSDGFLSFITWVSVVGVTLGVLSLTVVTSVINGFEGELTKAISGANGDVILYSRADPFTDGPEIETGIRDALPGVKAVTSSLITELMAAGPGGTSGVVLEGVDLATVGQATSLPTRIIEGRLPADDGEIVLGAVVAQKVGLKIGQEIRLVIPSLGEEEGGARMQRKAPERRAGVLNARIVGIVKLGMYEYDSKYAFATLPWVQKAFGLPGRVSAFKIKLQNRALAPQAAQTLADRFGYPFRAKDWGSLNKNLLYAIQLEKIVIGLILMVIIVVAAFNVVSTLMMMIHDKTREIAILKAMGLRRGQSFALFTLIGAGIGLVGTVSGVGLGMLLNAILARSKLIQLPADIYFIEFLPVYVNPKEIVLIALSAFMITVLATLYPAARVSTQSPMDGIRYD